jgi:hypothetical protein
VELNQHWIPIWNVSVAIKLTLEDFAWFPYLLLEPLRSVLEIILDGHHVALAQHLGIRYHDVVNYPLITEK